MDNKDLLDYCDRLREISGFINDAQLAECIDNISDKIYENKYYIAMMGQFSVGKSTFINALLGDELLLTANRESTGVITTIEYGDVPVAEIVDDDDTVIETISLDNNEGRKKLSEFLNISNENNQNVKIVRIQYPIEGFGRDIVFADTPGIEGLSLKQKNMAAEYIEKHANAILYLIGKTGFNAGDTKILSGQDEIIGKISSNKIFVVMTHISEVFESHKDNNPEDHIKNMVAKAQKQLSDGGVAGTEIRFYPVDSYDYLIGKSDEFYKKEKQNWDESKRTMYGEMPSRGEYIRRSKFEALLSDLRQQLSGDKLAAEIRNDIYEEIRAVLDAIKDAVAEKDNKEKAGISIRQEIIAEQIDRIADTRREFINHLIGIARNDFNDYSEMISQDIREHEKNRKAAVTRNIENNFRDVDDFNERKINIFSQTEKCNTENDTNELISRVKEHKNTFVNKELTESFDISFAEKYGKKISVEFSLQVRELEIDLSNENSNYEMSDDISKKEKELEEKKLELIRAQQEKRNGEDANKRIEKRIEDLEEKLSETKRRKKRALSANEKPQPTQKYKSAYRTEGILFWKKTVEYQVPDGLDYSNIKKWQKEQNKIGNEFEGKIDNIVNEISTLRNSETNIKILESKIERCIREVRRTEDKIDEMKKENNKLTEISRSLFIDSKREEINTCLDKIIEDDYDKLSNAVWQFLKSSEDDIISAVKTEANLKVDEYRKEIESENRQLSESLDIPDETIKVVNEKINELEETLFNERKI